jgi:hypothetical protein
MRDRLVFANALLAQIGAIQRQGVRMFWNLHSIHNAVHNILGTGKPRFGDKQPVTNSEQTVYLKC